MPELPTRNYPSFFSLPVTEIGVSGGTHQQIKAGYGRLVVNQFNYNVQAHWVGAMLKAGFTESFRPSVSLSFFYAPLIASIGSTDLYLGLEAEAGTEFNNRIRGLSSLSGFCRWQVKDHIAITAVAGPGVFWNSSDPVNWYGNANIGISYLFHKL